MPMGVFDFKSIGQKLEHNEQKADFEEKNPKPVKADPLSGHLPEWGYGMVPLVAANDPPCAALVAANIPTRDL